MKLSDDLSPKWILMKALLFLFILIVASMILIFQDDELLKLFCLGCVIWSSARLYYFAFYVIGNYLDPQYKFTGLISAVRHLLKLNR